MLFLSSVDMIDRTWKNFMASTIELVGIIGKIVSNEKVQQKVSKEYKVEMYMRFTYYSRR